ncbi:hypothetical protein JHK87_000604 [Glycine soja]|nr:hypothetical protein JHK87_000604 [Glycine soja]
MVLLHLLLAVSRKRTKRLHCCTSSPLFPPRSLALEAGGPSIQYTNFPPQLEGFYQPMGVNPTLQIG